jgi:hypothetical protein
MDDHTPAKPHKPLTIFLDFDGVLHPQQAQRGQEWSWLGRIEFLLHEALQDPSAQIVISSAWRIYHSVDELRAYVGPQIAAKVIDTTPIFEPSTREEECLAWLEANGLTDAPWIAIDDLASDFKNHSAEHLVPIDPVFGPGPDDMARFRSLWVAQVQRQSGQLPMEYEPRRPSGRAPAVIFIDIDWMCAPEGRSMHPHARSSMKDLIKRSRTYFDLNIVACSSWLRTRRAEEVAHALPWDVRKHLYAHFHPEKSAAAIWKMIALDAPLSLQDCERFIEAESLAGVPWAALLIGTHQLSGREPEPHTVVLDHPPQVAARNIEQVLRALWTQAEAVFAPHFPISTSARWVLDARYPAFFSKRQWISCSAPVGWTQRLVKLFGDLDALLGERAQDFRIEQMKEKFGGLRLYWKINTRASGREPWPPELVEQVRALISSAEDETNSLCQSCGLPGRQDGWDTGSELTWIATRCRFHQWRAIRTATEGLRSELDAKVSI